MERKSTGERLQELMLKNNMKQVDILEATAKYCELYDVKMNKKSREFISRDFLLKKKRF